MLRFNYIYENPLLFLKVSLIFLLLSLNISFSQQGAHDEDDKKHGDDIKLDAEANLRLPDSGYSALICIEFVFDIGTRTQKRGEQNNNCPESECQG